jgi:hypothetical protein
MGSDESGSGCGQWWALICLEFEERAVDPLVSAASVGNPLIDTAKISN